MGIMTGCFDGCLKDRDESKVRRLKIKKISVHSQRYRTTAISYTTAGQWQ